VEVAHAQACSLCLVGGGRRACGGHTRPSMCARVNSRVYVVRARAKVRVSGVCALYIISGTYVYAYVCVCVCLCVCVYVCVCVCVCVPRSQVTPAPVRRPRSPPEGLPHSHQHPERPPHLHQHPERPPHPYARPRRLARVAVQYPARRAVYECVCDMYVCVACICVCVACMRDRCRCRSLSLSVVSVDIKTQATKLAEDLNTDRKFICLYHELFQNARAWQMCVHNMSVHT